MLDESWTLKLLPVTYPWGELVVNVVSPVTESNVDDETISSCPTFNKYSPAWMSSEAVIAIATWFAAGTPVIL